MNSANPLYRAHKSTSKCTGVVDSDTVTTPWPQKCQTSQPFHTYCTESTSFFTSSRILNLLYFRVSNPNLKPIPLLTTISSLSKVTSKFHRVRRGPQEPLPNTNFSSLRMDHHSTQPPLAHCTTCFGAISTDTIAVWTHIPLFLSLSGLMWSLKWAYPKLLFTKGITHRPHP